MRSIRAAVLAGAACLWACAAWAQIPEQPYVEAGDRLALSAEVAATIAPHDDSAFFNYTDYDHDALRTLRVRLLAEWRAAPHWSVLGEVRAENTNSIQAAALYVRWHPWSERDFDIQVGRVPPVIGAFARHAYGRDNIVIGFPLAYQYLTSLRSDAQPNSTDDILRMRARGWRPSYPVGSKAEAGGIPLVSAFDWDTGVEAHLRAGRLEYAGAITRGAPGSPAMGHARPAPNLSGRLAASILPGFVAGLSAALGHWVNDDLLSTFPDTHAGSSQTVIGTDMEYGRGRTLVRAEWLRTAFEVPLVPSVSRLTSTSVFVEGRYRFHPRWQASGRVERLDFGDIHGTLTDVVASWDAPVNRLELVVGYRAARNVEIRMGWQRNHRDGGRVHDRNYPAAQVLYWF